MRKWFRFDFGVVGIVAVGMITAVGLMSCMQRKVEGVRNAHKDTAQTAHRKYVGTDDSGRLAYWIPEKDSINHDFVLVAEQLWKIPDTFDYDNRMKWHKKCEDALVHCFDSIHPNSRLSVYEKADSMANVIDRFIQKDADDSTMGMILFQGLENKFLCYKIASLSKEILKLDKSFDKEIRKWYELEENMNDFCCGVVRVAWFGGSGVGPTVNFTINNVFRARIADLNNILAFYKNGSTPSSWSMESAMHDFKNAVEKAAQDLIGDDNCLFDDKESKENYNKIRREALDAKPAFLKTTEQWVELRKGYFAPEKGSGYDRITSEMLARMAYVVLQTNPVAGED